MIGRTWGALASTCLGLLAVLLSLDPEGMPHATRTTANGPPASAVTEEQDDLRDLVSQSSQRPGLSSDRDDVLPRLPCVGEGLVGAPRRAEQCRCARPDC